MLIVNFTTRLQLESEWHTTLHTVTGGSDTNPMCPCSTPHLQLPHLSAL